MPTSQMAVFHGAGQPFTLETTELPPLQAGEILVRNEYTTLCRSDLNTCAGKRQEPTPTILGHETVGVIAALGPDAPVVDARHQPLRVGDRVTWAIYAADPETPLARQGIPQKAPGLFKYGHERITPASTLHGGLAEYCILRWHTPVVRLNPALPLPVMALINCSVATVAGSLRLAGSVAGTSVLIAGAGMLGVIACAMCRAAGAKNIIALDVAPDRLATARTFGANHTVNLASGTASLAGELAALLQGETCAFALDYSGIPETMEALVGVLGIGGTAVLVGATFPQRPLQISAEQLIRKVHTLKGLHNYNATDLITATRFLEQHHQSYPWGGLIHEGFTLSTVNAAFAHGLNSPAYRVGIRLT